MKEIREHRHVSLRDELTEEEWLDMWRPRVSPGKVTLTSRLQGPGTTAQARDGATPTVQAQYGASMQRQAPSEAEADARRAEMTRWETAALLGYDPEDPTAEDREEIHEFAATAVQTSNNADSPVSADEIMRLAEEGTKSSGDELPHFNAIQRSFGKHDVGSVKAYSNERAHTTAHALGARAYAMGESVVLGKNADMHTVAHEAAHVVQQRGGVVLKDGIGQSGDPYEQHADAVADLVVRGQSAEALLDRYAGSGRDAGVQRLQFDLESVETYQAWLREERDAVKLERMRRQLESIIRRSPTRQHVLRLDSERLSITAGEAQDLLTQTTQRIDQVTQESPLTQSLRLHYGVERGANQGSPTRLDAWGEQGLLVRPGGPGSLAIPRWERLESHVQTAGRDQARARVRESRQLLDPVHQDADVSLALAVLTFEATGQDPFTSRPGQIIVSGAHDFHPGGVAGFDNIFNQASQDERRRMHMTPIAPDQSLPGVRRRIERNEDFAAFRSARIAREYLLATAMIAVDEAEETFRRHFTTIMREILGNNADHSRETTDTNISQYLDYMSLDARRAWTQLMFGAPSIHARARPLISYLYRQSAGDVSFLNRIMTEDEAALVSQSRSLTVDVIHRARATAMTARGIDATIGDVIEPSDSQHIELQ